MYRTRGVPRNLWKFQERTFPRKVWEKAVPNFICVTMVHLFQNSGIRKLLARDIQLNLEQHGFNCVGCFVLFSINTYYTVHSCLIPQMVKAQANKKG